MQIMQVCIINTHVIGIVIGMMMITSIASCEIIVRLSMVIVRLSMVILILVVILNWLLTEEEIECRKNSRNSQNHGGRLLVRRTSPSRKMMTIRSKPHQSTRGARIAKAALAAGATLRDEQQSGQNCPEYQEFA
mmetsp:Transcript_10218/g.18627  ORF Transcript_10218/g.18627 Transcript_10218/m.18627 type:complete len:134 (-) Transcript_10218:30-431(-)